MGNGGKGLRVGDIVDALREEFSRLSPAVDTPLESTSELAARFGVAALTADRAIRKLVDEGVLYRVKGRGTFFKEAPRKALPPLLGFASLAHYPIPEIQRATELAMTTLRQAGARLKFIHHQQLCSVVEGRRELAETDGLLLSCDLIDPQVRETLATYRNPIVVRGRDFVGIDEYHQVALNFLPTFHDIVRRLLAEPVPRKLLILQEPHANGEHRGAEFLRLFLAHGGKTELAETLSISLYRGAFHAVESLRQAEIAGKFIFSTSDLVSELLLQAAKSRDLLPQRDFELVSCDNLSADNFNSSPTPELTTVDCFSDECAVSAAKLLFDLVQRPAQHQHIIRIQTKLITRNTAWSH